MNKTEQDIGFVIPKLEHNPLCNKIIDCINQFIANNPNNQYIIFNSFNDRYDTHTIPVLHLSESKFFYGKLFLFDLISVILTEKFPNVYHRFLYLQDIPWKENPTTGYKNHEKVFNQNKLDFISKNNHINDIYSICWKKPLCISEEFDYDTIKKIV
jgi:hypothetical protein|tara:strand:+ start:8554 stop:9021 length:468 start_codon:yes stop_codon:yes gene_type:complete